MEQVTPVVGMGTTKNVGSDRYAYTIIQVLSPRKIVVQLDRQRCVSGNECTSEVQDWECTPDPNGVTAIVTRRSNGRWVMMGQDMHSSGFSIGHRSPHYDPHF